MYQQYPNAEVNMVELPNKGNFANCEITGKSLAKTSIYKKGREGQI